MTSRKKPKKTDYMLKFATVTYWLGQLNESGFRNHADARSSTKSVYLSYLTQFDGWVAGRVFDVRAQTVAGGSIIHETVQKSFADVEKLLRFGEEGNEKEVRKIISQYLAELRRTNLARSTISGKCAAIKSYFDVHDVITNVRLNGRKNKKYEVTRGPELELVEFYKIMTTAKMNPMMRAMLLVKFQAGLDSSTLADRFNFYAYKQIAGWCGTADHKKWDLGKCPIPIELVRVKTGIEFTTFIDRDALAALKYYLAWREERHGPHDPKEPIFVTTKNRPIHPEGVSDAFGRMAASSGTQKRLARGILKLKSHGVRRLLKSLLMACGCAAWAADHVIGHAPKDAYEGPADLFPKDLRREYAKASHRINVLSKAVSNIDDPEPADAAEKALKASEARVEELEKRVNELTEANAKKDARSADAESKLDMVVRAIIDASSEHDGDFRQNLKDRLGGLP